MNASAAAEEQHSHATPYKCVDAQGKSQSGWCCANDPEEAVYINTSIDSHGNELNGSNRNSMIFSAGNFPPFNADMHGFWSVTLYNSTYNLCPGSSNYSINGYYPEFSTTDAEGSITIVIQSEKLDTLPARSYWLQSPSDESFF